MLPYFFQLALFTIIFALFTFKFLFEKDANGIGSSDLLGSHHILTHRHLLSNPLEDASVQVHQNWLKKSAFASPPSLDGDKSRQEKGRGLFKRRRRWRKNLRATGDSILQSGEWTRNTSGVDLPGLGLFLHPKSSRSLPDSVQTAPGGYSQPQFDPAAPMAAIGCLNQTRCIQPQLQLRQHFFVYYCKHVGHGVRFYFLVRKSIPCLRANTLHVSLGRCISRAYNH